MEFAIEVPCNFESMVMDVVFLEFEVEVMFVDG
jgi:hypothetical protein